MVLLERNRRVLSSEISRFRTSLSMCLWNRVAEKWKTVKSSSAKAKLYWVNTRLSEKESEKKVIRWANKVQKVYGWVQVWSGQLCPSLIFQQASWQLIWSLSWTNGNYCDRSSRHYQSSRSNDRQSLLRSYQSAATFQAADWDDQGSALGDRLG